MTINTKTLTAANAVLQARCVGLYDQYVEMGGYQPDNATSFGDRTIGETRASVDGILSGGKVFNEGQFTAFFEANSKSLTVMDNYNNWQQDPNHDALPWDFILTYPSIKKRYTFSGFLVTTPAGVSAQKLLAGVQYVWNIDNAKIEDIN